MRPPLPPKRPEPGGRRARGPGRRRAVAGALGLAGAALVPGATADPLCEAAPQRGAFVATAADLRGRTRVFAVPGDLGLRNASVTALVRRADGWLVDFWPNRAVTPTAAQLADDPAVDPLWALHGEIRDARGPFKLHAHEVRHDGDAIVTVARLALGSGAVEVTTRYRLDGDQPRLLLEATLRHASGGKVAAITFGEQVRWGNTDYFVDGFGKTKPTFTGKGWWVGRRGAGGDLRLRGLDALPLIVDYRQLETGSAPAVHAMGPTLTLAPGASVTQRRALEFAPIEAPAAPAPAGTLVVTVLDEAGAPLAAKLGFRGVAPTPDPQFGNDGDESGAGRFAWSGTGRFDRALPPGTYDVTATAGFERDLARWRVTVAADQRVEVSGTLPRVVFTPGWASGDLHLHQSASVDADIARSTRVISVAAEGVELAVASDHYVADDLAPAVARLVTEGRLARPLTTVIGTELSTLGHLFGHFNLFPLAAAGPVAVNTQDTQPRALFAEARAAAPAALLQVNHPRFDGLGYFHRYKLDPESGRFPAASLEAYDPNFDLLEVFNGMDAPTEPQVRLVLEDWMRLLGQGRRYVATGSSDSHKLFFFDPGQPRTWVRWSDGAGGDAADGAPDVGAYMAALKAGHAIVSGGPFVEVTVDGGAAGSAAATAGGVGPGGTVALRGRKEVSLRLRVLAPPWMDVSTVEVLMGGQANRVRYTELPPRAAGAPVRLDSTFPLRVEPGAFIVVVARGKRPLPNTYLPIRPLAFTNPVWFGP